MGTKVKEMGGGPTVGLADDYVSALQSLLNGGGVGTAGSPNAGGSTTNIMSVLAGLLDPNGKQGTAIQQLLSTQQTRDVNAIRSRFGAFGGTAFGTPAAYAETNYRAQAAPNIVSALGQMQLSAALPLLQQIGQFSSMGIAPRQLVQQKSTLGQIFGTVAGVAGAAAPFFAPGLGGGGKAGDNMSPYGGTGNNMPTGGFIPGENANYNQPTGTSYWGS